MRCGWIVAQVLILLAVIDVRSHLLDSSTARGGAPQRHVLSRRHGNAHRATPRTPVDSTPLCSFQCLGNVTSKELKRNFRMDSVKDDILRKLRMTEPPNVTGRIPDVPAMQNLLNQMIEDGHGSMATIEMEMDMISPTNIILLSQNVPQERRSSFPNTCFFRFSPELKDDQVVSASLGIYIRDRNTLARVPHRTGSPAATWILVYAISRTPRTNLLEKTLYRKRKIFLGPADTGKWYFFDIKSLVENWTQHEELNYGIQIIAYDRIGEPLAVLPTTDESQSGLQPYIEVKVSNRQSNRLRRSMQPAQLDCVEASAEHRCCRYPLTIDFEAFRWDWIIAPKRYDAYYCSGECQVLYFTSNTHSHTHVSSQQHPRSGQGVPCCSPTHMSPLQLLYMNSNLNVVYGTLPGMIVDRCGCS